SYTNSATVYDSLGTPHDLTMIFTNNNDNTWTVSLELNGAPMNMVGGTTLTYDTNGLSGMTSFAANLDMGPNVSQLELDLNVNSTQFASHSQLNALQQNGYAAGDLLGITINDDGSIIGNYSNLQTAEIGTIVLANFINPEGLQAIGDNAWIISASSGEPLLGRPGEGKFGLVESGALEGSNVDMTAELVNLIIAQRYYQSNAQTIKVQDEVLQTTINMR
ncbi:MAG TPA: flagellar hook-basal body complex protein, partial [Porticoccaceae bacterium]